MSRETEKHRLPTVRLVKFDSDALLSVRLLEHVAVEFRKVGFDDAVHLSPHLFVHFHLEMNTLNGMADVLFSRNGNCTTEGIQYRYRFFSMPKVAASTPEGHTSSRTSSSILLDSESRFSPDICSSDRTLSILSAAVWKKISMVRLRNLILQIQAKKGFQ